MIPRPATTAGELCWATLLPAIAICVFFALIYGFAVLDGCAINEGGAGQCAIGPLDIMQPLTVAFGVAGLSLLATPLLFLIALVSGTVCIVRRRW